MEYMPKLFDRDIDAGPKGITGYYDEMMTVLREHGHKALRAWLIFLWAATWPFEIELYRLTGFVTVALLIKLGLLFWAVTASLPLVAARNAARRWRKLEAQGMAFYTVNKHRLRVVKYRMADGGIGWEGKTRSDRFFEEHKAVHNRQLALERDAISLVRPLMILLAMMFLFWLAHAIADPFFARYLAESTDPFVQEGLRWWLSVHTPLPFNQPVVQQLDALFARYSIESLALAVWFLGAILPTLVLLGLTLLEIRIYQSNAQFITGAHVLDAVEPEIHIEAMESEKIYGEAGFVRPKTAVHLMASEDL